MRPGRDLYWDELPDAPLARPEPMEANEPLTIIYTSGTTGKPKGIVHSHGGFLVKAALDFGYLFDVQEDDVVAWTADLGWMLGPLLMLGGLHFGATIVLIEGVPDFPDGQRLWDIVRASPGDGPEGSRRRRRVRSARARTPRPARALITCGPSPRPASRGTNPPGAGCSRRSAGRGTRS